MLRRKGRVMNEDLRAMGSDSYYEGRANLRGDDMSPADWSAFMDRFNAFDEKLDRVLKAVEKDVSIDESNNDKVSITEAEGKINEKEEYRKADEKKGEDE